MHPENSRKAAPNGREFETRLQATLNIIPAYTWYAAPSGALTFVNKRCADYLGLPVDHPLRFGIPTGAEWDSHIPLLHPNDHEETRKVWVTCLRNGCAGEVPFRVRNAAGQYRWFLSRAEPLRASDGQALYWIGINLDVEELKQAEFYLAEGQRLAHTGTWLFNPSGFDYWSSELFKIHGLQSGGEAPSLEEYLSLVHPEDRGFVEQEIQKMFANHSEFDFTKRIVRPDGKVRHVRCVGVPATTGTTSHEFVGTGIDVTEQVQLTEELRRREAYLSEAQRLSHTGSFGWKSCDGSMVWSCQTYRIFEYDGSQKPTFDMVYQRVHADDRAAVRQVIERASSTGADFEHEYRLLMPSGTLKHVQVRVHCLRDFSGKTEFIGAVTDITDRKTAEERIRRQEAEFRQMLDFTPQLLGVLGADGTPIYANRASLDYLGMTLDEWLHRRQIGEEVHPNDLERVMADLQRALSTGSAVEIEERVRKSDGTYRWFLSVFNPVRDENGELMRWTPLFGQNSGRP